MDQDKRFTETYIHTHTQTKGKQKMERVGKKKYDIILFYCVIMHHVMNDETKAAKSHFPTNENVECVYI